MRTILYHLGVQLCESPARWPRWLHWLDVALRRQQAHRQWPVCPRCGATMEEEDGDPESYMRWWRCAGCGRHREGRPR